jgi:hypothetical protein
MHRLGRECPGGEVGEEQQFGAGIQAAGQQADDLRDDELRMISAPSWLARNSIQR